MLDNIFFIIMTKFVGKIYLKRNRSHEKNNTILWSYSAHLTYFM